MSRSRSDRGSAGVLWRLVGAALLAVSMVLLSPAAFASAQEDVPGDEVPGDEVPGDEVPGDEVPGDEVPGDEVPGDEVPGDEVPGDEVPDETPEDEAPEDETPEEDDGIVELQGQNIRIVHTPDEEQGNCSPVPATALTKYIGSDEAEFRLRIVAQDPLCDPITATAAIYGMPGNGEAWPQNLVETLDFIIADAGEYLVTFTKTCDPVQFDIVTGATPPTIAPLGEWHGPLLFPFDTATSLQHWGCPEVLAETTVPEVAPAALALTGTSTSSWAALAGGSALLAGAGLLLVNRRRSV